MAKNFNKKAGQMTSKLFIRTQTRKTISATAGVQSIIESPVGAFKVVNLDKWLYFTNIKNEVDDNGNYIFEIKEPRLLNRLRNTGIFNNLQRIFKAPVNVNNENDRTIPANQFYIGGAEYFPKWFFCETCKRFKTIDEWWRGWVDVLRHDEQINDSDRIRKNFLYDPQRTGKPNCYCCYRENLENGNHRKKFNKLEQVRFILVSPDGNIKDIDWTKWITAEKLKLNENEEQTEEYENARYVLGKENCCDNVSLKYIRSNKLSDLAGITIQCENCGKTKTLAGFFNLRVGKGIIQDSQNINYNIYYKPLIRTSNSVYYPIIMHSLYIPQPEIHLTDAQKTTIRVLNAAGNTNEQIAKNVKIELKDVERILGESIYLSETEYRKGEYQYLLDSDSNNSFDKDFKIGHNSLNEELKSFGFDKIIKINRLKITSVQTGYTRLSPMDNDLFSSSGEKKIRFDNQEVPLKPRYTVSDPCKTEYLMGIESFGEGIFIKFKDDSIHEFIENYKDNESSKKNLCDLNDRLNQNEMFRKDKFSGDNHLIKFLLIHSFSHLIIKELEFLCGYPSASISERIYCDADSMNGVLIYTIAGSEGSFGGLIKQAENENFSKILKSALFRAKDCSSDPICYESEGQGIGGLNFAACYSCVLVSETSCEEFNSFLDRKVLIDNEFGFFKNVN